MTDEPPDDPPPAPPAAPLPSIIVDDDHLPVTSGSDEELRDAVGEIADKSAPKAMAKSPQPASDHDHDHDHDDHGVPPHKRSRAAFIAGVCLVGALGVGTLILLGHLNAGRYEIACAPDEIRAEHGRAFPPWGAREMTGNEWKAIAIPADAECTPQDADSEDALGVVFLGMLVERADRSLLARDPAQAEVAAAELQQALLLARAPERRDERKTIERMLGDVDYWRASSKLASARQQLLDAAKQFEAASAQVPRHVTDAASWATFVHRVIDDLQAGPGGVHAGSAATTASSPEHGDRVPAPPGVALPIEPAPGTTGLPMPASPTADAGVAAGGVLL